jgi:hypothetical protein
MSELKRMTIGELKKIIKDLPDEAFVLGLEDHRPTTEIFVVTDESKYHPCIKIENKNEFFDDEFAEGYELEIKKEMKHDEFLLIDFS